MINNFYEFRVYFGEMIADIYIRNRGYKEKFPEIQRYGLILLEDYKNIIKQNPDIKYNDIKELFDQFLCFYTIDNMMCYRWNPLSYQVAYCGEIVYEEDLEKYLYYEDNIPQLLFHWNEFVCDKYARILTYGSDLIFDFCKNNIENIWSYNSGRVLCNGNFAWKLVDMVFHEKEIQTLNIRTEVLIEINNLSYFQEKTNIPILLSSKNLMKYDFYGNLKMHLFTIENPNFYFILLQSISKIDKYNKDENIDYNFYALFVNNTFDNSKSDIYFKEIERFYEIFYTFHSGEMRDYVRIKEVSENIFTENFNSLKDFFINDNWFLLSSIFDYEDKNIYLFNSNKSPFLIRHKYKITYFDNERDFVNLLLNSGNKNVKFAMKTK